LKGLETTQRWVGDKWFPDWLKVNEKKGEALSDSAHSFYRRRFFLLAKATNARYSLASRVTWLA